MIFDHRYPGTDLHEIDLAYILGEIQALKYKLDNYVKENTFHLADPLDWNISSQYSACTIVKYNDNRLYLSAKPVPAGIQITNTEYWLNLIDCSGGGGGDYQDRTVSFIPTETQQILDVLPESGYDALSSVRVIVQAISNLFVGSGIPRRGSADLTAAGATVTAPSGYYQASASKSVQAGGEGIPVATKGTVTNHSVNVTPSVTNTEGYIPGGTQTGTAVTVTAAELDSGTKSIVANGTGIDVVGYAAVDVAVPGQTPTLQTKSVTYTPTGSNIVEPITADTGYDGLAQVNVTVEGVVCTNLTAANIVSGVTVKIGTASDDDSVTSVTGTASGGGITVDEMASHSAPSGDITITAGPNRIVERAFYYCPITGVTITTNTTIPGQTFSYCSNLTYVTSSSVTAMGGNQQFINCTSLTNINLPNITTLAGNAFQGCTSLQIFDLPKLTSLNYTRCLYGCSSLNTIVLRSQSIVPISNDCLTNTPFGSGGSGGTIYIPETLYNALGTGTNDYKATSNWSTYDGYGTITWAKIEGSIYEI